ncbi:MAG: FecR family protein, partial [Chitinophagaceae bacterium]
MQLNKEEIRILIIEKLAGSIEPADDLLIGQLINEHDDVRQMWLEMSEALRSAESGGFNPDADPQQQWNRIAPLLANPIRSSERHVMAIRIMAAASILAIVVTGYLWLRSAKSSAKSLEESSIAKVKIKVPTLRLPNNQVLELNSNTQKKFRVGDAVFEIDNNTLSYKTGTGNHDQWIFSTPPGIDYKIELSDGTAIWLNAATRLKFPASFGTAIREVDIDGEAFFNVAENKKSFFIVHTPATEVLVTGTRFNVSTYDTNKIQTALVEGSVTVRNRIKREIKLKPGYEAEFTGEAGFSTHPFDSVEVLSWMKGIYYFRNTPLKELSIVIKRWYDVD